MSLDLDAAVSKFPLFCLHTSYCHLAFVSFFEFFTNLTQMVSWLKLGFQEKEKDKDEEDEEDEAIDPTMCGKFLG